MTALYLDGFDHYGSGPFGAGNMLDGAWAQVQTHGGPGVPAWGTRTGTGSIISGDVSVPYRYVLPTPKTRIFQSFGFSVDGLPITNFTTEICRFMKADNTVFAKLWCQADGSITLSDGSTTVLATTQGPIVTSRSWHFMEMDFNPTGGDFTLRVDDATAANTPVIAATGISFASATVGQLGYLFITGGNATTSWLDDLFIRDTAGDNNNSWLGDRRIATLYADSDTEVSAWTPSYYKKFGAGILRMGFIIPNTNTLQNDAANVFTGAATSLDIGSSDYTIETMIRFDSLPSASGYHSIFSRWDVANNERSYRLILGGSSFNNSCLQFDTSTDGLSGTVSTPILYPWVPVLNTYYHLAIVRASGEDLLFVDGKQLGLPVTDSNAYFSGGAEKLAIGSEVTTIGGVLVQPVAGTTLSGRMDETRFTNGVGRYTATFSPPVAAFPRGTSDPDWAQVVLLMGYNSGIEDESSFARTVVGQTGAISYIPTDGPDVGVYSTVNKAVPDDNTFISAGLSNATNILTMTTQPTAGNTITLGTTDGTTPAVYTFRASVSSAFDVLIDTTAQGTLTNFLNAVNAGTGSGTKYGTGTTSNFDVNGVPLPPGQIEVVANTAGATGNSIPSTKTGTAASWASTTLLGGADIPGPTQFLFQRPPNNTTIISALQTNVRALKTDAGTADIQTAFIGPLGGEIDGGTHPLTVTPDYYADIIEVDPDTSGPLSPTSIINGKFQIDRTS